jgi:hypothetical protein
MGSSYAVSAGLRQMGWEAALLAQLSCLEQGEIADS